MPLKHRTVHYSPQGVPFLDVAEETFREWLGSRHGVTDPGSIGRDGQYVEIGGGHRARVERVEEEGRTMVRYSHITINENGTYSTQLTALREGTETWAQLDVHAPHQNSMFAAPRLPGMLLDAAGQRGAHLFDGTVRNSFSSAPKRVRADELGDFIDEVLESPHRTTTAFVAGLGHDDSYGRWSETFQTWLRDSQAVATLWLLDAEATGEFNRYMVAKGYEVYPRSIHSFQPGADLSDSADSLRHRWFSARDLADSSTRRNQQRLYHLARATALGQRLPEELVHADRDIREEALRLRLSEGVHGSSLRERIHKPPVEQPRETGPLTSDAPRPDASPRPGPTHRPRITPGMLPPHRPVPPTRPVAPPTPPPVPQTPTPDVGAEVTELVHELCGEINVTPHADQPLDDLLIDVFDLVLRERRKVANAERLLAEKESDLEALTDQHNELEQFWEETVEEFGEDDLEEASLRHQINRYAMQLQRLQAPPEAYDLPERDNPTRLEEVLERLRRKTLPHVVFTGNEKLCTRLDDRPNSQALAGMCWDFLVTLDSYAEQWANGKQSVERYIATGTSLAKPSRHAASESKATKNNQDYAAARRFKVPASVDGEGWVHMWAHYKLAQDGGKAPRLHYYDAMGQDGKVYVGYIGEHLPNTMTN